MDTVHDLGGRQGFGPLPHVDQDDTSLFAEDWHGRVWATALMMMGKLSEDQTGWTLDWYRHVLERLPPDAYLQLNYFEKWILGVMATAIDEGVATAEDFAAGASDAQPFSYVGNRPLAEVDAPPARFKPGDAITTVAEVGSMHTRLTGYLRGRPGVIDSVIGPQPLPDLAAIGTLRNEETYIVRFRMADLWPEAAGSSDTLCVDLWDSYLEPA